MSVESVESSFHLNLEAIELLQNALTTSFFEAYLEQVGNILDEYDVQVISDVPDTQTVEKLKTIYQELQSKNLESEEIRKLAQLLLLKGTQSEPVQANHQLTPDSIGFLFVYLIEQFYPNKKEALSILDVGVGTGNLLFTLLTNLKMSGYDSRGFGIDNDELLIEIAAANNQWIQANATLIHHDALQQEVPELVDVAVSDLPIGYYPIDSIAYSFETASKQGHSYAHHLLVEQAMKQVRENGFGLFLLPSNFLESDQSEYFKNWLGKSAYLQGIIQLPDELFKNEASRKSIVILQNKGAEAKQADQILVAQLASLKDPQKVAHFFTEVTAWKQANI